MSRGRGFSGVSVFAVLQCVQKKQRRAALQIEGGMDLRYRRKLFRLRDPYDIEASQDLFLQAVRENCAYHYAHCGEYRAILEHFHFSPETLRCEMCIRDRPQAQAFPRCRATIRGMCAVRRSHRCPWHGNCWYKAAEAQAPRGCRQAGRAGSVGGPQAAADQTDKRFQRRNRSCNAPPWGLSLIHIWRYPFAASPSAAWKRIKSSSWA